MTNDPIDEVLHAYLDHVEKGTPEPSLDHLGPEDRQLVADIIDSMNAGRGINPYRSRPSYSTLAASTQAGADAAASANLGLTLDAIRDDVSVTLGTSPVVDGAAEYEGISSNAVARCGAHRVRFQFLDTITTVSDLANIHPQVAVGPVFGRFPETAIVVVVIGDAVRSSVAIDLYDTEPYIGSPDGEIHPPRLSRPILPLPDTLRLVAGEFTTTIGSDEVVPQSQNIEIDVIVDQESHAACAAIAAEGRRARTDAKKAAWGNFDATPWLNDLAVLAYSGDLTDDDFEAQLTAQAAAA
jgi:hypothetical protein